MYFQFFLKSHFNIDKYFITIVLKYQKFHWKFSLIKDLKAFDETVPVIFPSNNFPSISELNECWKVYRRVSIVVLNQFLWVSRKFENNRYTPLAQVRILSWDFFPLYFFYSFYQILIRSWDVELHTKFQPHKFIFCNRNSVFPVLEKTVSAKTIFQHFKLVGLG